MKFNLLQTFKILNMITCTNITRNDMLDLKVMMGELSKPIAAGSPQSEVIRGASIVCPHR
jgi:hypothetical protein